MVNFTVGCDPEIFVADEVLPRSVIGKIGGSKEAPLPLPIGDGFAVQEDNVALEFCVPPANSRRQFIENIKLATGFLEEEIKNKYNWKFDTRSAISFPEQELNDPRAFIFGCDPDFNAWTLDVNPRPRAKDKALRSAGGHVHIGCASMGVDPVRVVKAMDLFAGVPSVLMDNGILRKKLYGKAGAFRPKSYGVEYRTLSNFWIFEEKYIDWVYSAVESSLQCGIDLDEYKDSIISCINKNDKVLAKKLVDQFNLKVV